MAPISKFKQAPARLVGNTLTAVYTAPALKDSYLTALDISCTGNTGVQVDVVLTRAGLDYYWGKNLPIPLGSALSMIDDNKTVLEAGDIIKVRCGTVGETVDVLCSAVEDVNN